MWRLKSGEMVVDRHDSHLHKNVEALLKEVFTTISSDKRDLIVEEVSFNYVLGNTICVVTYPDDQIIYAKRPNRLGFTRFVKNRKPEPCSSVVVVLKKQGGNYYMISTAYIGHLAEPEPWDTCATENSQAFWASHAIIWGQEPVVPGTETKKCPKFYYGIFEYPKNSGNFYQGKHKPLITQELFEKAQAQLKRDRIVRENKEFAFTKMFTCGYCNSGISAEEKWKALKNGTSAHYIYYGCSRARDRNCKNKYIREEELIKELLKILDDLDINELGMRKRLEDEVARFSIFQRSVLGAKDKIMPAKEADIKNYAKYLLKEGSVSEKRELLGNLRTRIVYKDKELSLVDAD